MNRIRAARQARGWTQAELAVRAHISPRTIHAIEKGQACRQATKRKILIALAVPWTARDEFFRAWQRAAGAAAAGRERVAEPSGSGRALCLRSRLARPRDI